MNHQFNNGFRQKTFSKRLPIPPVKLRMSNVLVCMYKKRHGYHFFDGSKKAVFF